MIFLLKEVNNANHCSAAHTYKHWWWKWKALHLCRYVILSVKEIWWAGLRSVKHTSKGREFYCRGSKVQTFIPHDWIGSMSCSNSNTHAQKCTPHTHILTIRHIHANLVTCVIRRTHRRTYWSSSVPALYWPTLSFCPAVKRLSVSLSPHLTHSQEVHQCYYLLTEAQNLP